MSCNSFRLSISKDRIFDVDCDINPRCEHLGEVFARVSAGSSFIIPQAGGRRTDGRVLRNSRGTRDPLCAKLQVSRTGGGLGFSRRITRRRVLTVTLCHPPWQPAPSATALTASSPPFTSLINAICARCNRRDAFRKSMHPPTQCNSIIA